MAWPLMRTSMGVVTRAGGSVGKGSPGAMVGRVWRGCRGDVQNEGGAASAVGATAERVLGLGGEAHRHDFDVVHGASCTEEGSSAGDDGERSAGEACQVEVADGGAVGLEEFPTGFGDGGPGDIADRTAGVGCGRHADGMGADDVSAA
ncbi:MAG: hypothetical protein JNL62_24860 [Bryobacterales bacterium]|nr:hypothetical protein [Bryobacterales bacterium]